MSKFMDDLRLLRKLLRARQEPHLTLDYQFYLRWRFLIRVIVFLKINYVGCEIFRWKYKNRKNIVLVGLRNSGKKIKRRTLGFAKNFISTHPDPKCLYCRTKLTEANATTDHIIPISKRGNNSKMNLIVCCFDCNNQRGNLEFYEFLRSKNSKLAKIKHLFV